MNLNSTLDRLKKVQQATNSAAEVVVMVPLDKVVFDPTQPRLAFHAPDGVVAQNDEEALRELADSLQANGLIHSIIVQELPDGQYLVRVGERRTRAAKSLGWTHIRATVRNDLTGMGALALQLAENTDRQELSFLEIAQTIKRFTVQSDENPTPMNGKQIAALLKKSEGWVTRYLRFADESLQQKWVEPGYVTSPEVLYLLTTLPADVQEVIYADASTKRVSTPLSKSRVNIYKEHAARLAVQRVNEATASAGAGVVAGVVPVEPGSMTQVDAIGAALAAADPVTGMVSGLPQATTAVMAEPDGSGQFGDGRDGGYSLDPKEAADLRVPAAQEQPQAHAKGPSSVLTQRQPMAASVVPMRVNALVLQHLIDKLGDEVPELRRVEMEIRLSGQSALTIVQKLTGETIDEQAAGPLLAKALQDLMG